MYRDSESAVNAGNTIPSSEPITGLAVPIFSTLSYIYRGGAHLATCAGYCD